MSAATGSGGGASQAARNIEKSAKQSMRIVFSLAPDLIKCVGCRR
jgi:hypothetical protein